MTFNINQTDRFIRLLISIIVGLGIIIGQLSVEWILLSFVLLITAAFRFCPAYKIVDLLKNR